MTVLGPFTQTVRRADAVAAFAAGFVLCIAFQWFAGAYVAEFGYDEHSHYVSGLAIHDYLRALRPVLPIGFIARYHSAYPLIGIGHWGPAYYGLEALWMLLFGWSRTSMLLLSAAVTAAIGGLVYWTSVRIGGSRVLAAVAAAICVASPIARAASAALLLDQPIALLCLLAMIAFAGYLEAGRPRHAVWFAALATAGLMVKGNAFCLALLPPLAVVIAGRWDMVRRAWFWLPAVVAVVVAGPWYLATYHLISAGFRYRWGWDYTSVALPANGAFLAGAFGPLLPLASLAGMARVLVRRGNALCQCALALFVAVMFFQLLVPAALQDRYLLPALPPMAILAVHGVSWLRDWLGKPWVVPVCAAVIVAAALPSSMGLPPKTRFHLIEAAGAVWANRLPENPAVLLVMDGEAEGSAIAELAMRDTERPSMFAIRGSRLLGEGGYNSAEYRPKFHTDADAMAAIDAYAIPLVLLRFEASGSQWEHVDQIRRLRSAQPERWSRVYEYRDGETTVVLYRILGNDSRKADVARLRALSAPKSLGGG